MRLPQPKEHDSPPDPHPRWQTGSIFLPHIRNLHLPPASWKASIRQRPDSIPHGFMKSGDQGCNAGLSLLIIKKGFFAGALFQYFPGYYSGSVRFDLSGCRITISSVFRAVRPSPLANLAIISIMSSSISIFWLPNPFPAFRA